MARLLLESWRKRDLTSFQENLKENSKELNELYPDEGYMSIFQIIASTKSPESKDFTKVLLKAGASADLVNAVSGKAPIHYAAEVLNRPVLEAILSANADVNTKDSTGCTILHYLVKKVAPAKNKQQEQCLDLIFSTPDLDLDAKNNIGLTPILLAYHQDSWNVLKKLLSLGALVEDFDYSKDGKKTMKDEIIERCPEILQQLPTHDLTRTLTIVQPSMEQLRSLLIPSTEDKFCYTFKLYMDNMEKRIHPNTKLDCNDLLRNAIRRGLEKATSDVTTFILTQYSDTKESLKPHIYEACKYGKPKILKILLNFDGDLSPDENGATVLHMLAQVFDFSEDHKTCFNILKNDIEIDCKDKKGKTPLHYASLIEENEFIQILIDNGAKLFLTDDDGHQAYEGADINLIDTFLTSYIQNHRETYTYYFNYSFLNNYFNKNTKAETTSLILNKNSEMKEIFNLSNSNYSTLIQHPLIYAFILYKWKLIRPLSLINLIFSSLFFILFIAYNLINVYNGNNYQVWIVFLKVILIFLSCLNFFYNFIQILVPKNIKLIHYWVNIIFSAVIIIYLSLSFNINSRIIILIGCVLLLKVGINFLNCLSEFNNSLLSSYTFQVLLNIFFKSFNFYLIGILIFIICFIMLSKNCVISYDCSVFTLGGFFLEIPFEFSDLTGYRIEAVTQPIFLIFLIFLAIFLIHLTSTGVLIGKEILSNPDFYNLKIKISIITVYEEFLITNRNILIKYKQNIIINFILSLVDNCLDQILLFSKDSERLMLKQRENNILINFGIETKKKFWDKNVHLPQNVVNDLKIKLKKTKIEIKEIDENLVILKEITEKCDKVLDRLKMSAQILDKIDAKSGDFETLLISSLKISNLRDDSE